MPADHVLIGLPTYDGTSHNRLAIARLLKERPCHLNLVEFQGSILEHIFNLSWATALNNRNTTPPLTHFLLWHADVVPVEDSWLPKMLAEQKRVGADVLSAVIALKNDQGMTSTARDTDRWSPLRYTLTEALAQPETFTAPDILLNTGLMLVDFTKPWVEKIAFQTHSRIIQDDKNKFNCQVIPEDWDFSRQARALGASLWATRAIKVSHHGTYRYPNWIAWGHETDEAYRKSVGQN